MAAKSVHINLRLEAAEYEAVRRFAPDHGNLSEAIRRFLKKGLQAATAGMNGSPAPPEVTA